MSCGCAACQAKTKVKNMPNMVVVDPHGNVVAQIDPAKLQQLAPQGAGVIPGLMQAATKTGHLANLVAHDGSHGHPGMVPGIRACWGFNTGAGSPDWANDCGLYRGPVIPLPRGFPPPGSTDCAREQLSHCTVANLPFQWVPFSQGIEAGASGLDNQVSGTSGTLSNGLRMRTGSTDYGYLRALVLEESDPEISVGKFRAPDITQSYNEWDRSAAIIGNPEDALRAATDWTWDRLWKGQNFIAAWVPSYNMGTKSSSRFVDIMMANSDTSVTRFARGQALIDYRAPARWPSLTMENYSPQAQQNAMAAAGGPYRVVQLAHG